MSKEPGPEITPFDDFMGGLVVAIIILSFWGLSQGLFNLVDWMSK